MRTVLGRVMKGSAGWSSSKQRFGKEPYLGPVQAFDAFQKSSIGPVGLDRCTTIFFFFFS